MFSDAGRERWLPRPPRPQDRFALPFHTSRPLRPCTFAKLPNEVVREIALALLEQDDRPGFVAPSDKIGRLPSSLSVMALLGISPHLRRRLLSSEVDLLGLIRLGQLETASRSSLLMRRHRPRTVIVSELETLGEDGAAPLIDSWARIAFGLVHWTRFPRPVGSLESSLEKFIVSLGHSYPLQLVWDVLSLQRSTLRLETVSVRTMLSTSSVTAPPFPLHNLRHLSFHRVELAKPTSLLALLEATPGLRTLVVSESANLDVDDCPDVPPHPRDVVLPDLRQLRVENTDPFCHPSVSRLRAPNLRRITLVGPSENSLHAWASYLPRRPDGTVAVTDLQSLELAVDDRDELGYPFLSSHHSAVEALVNLLPSIPRLDRLYIKGLNDPHGRLPAALSLPALPSSPANLPLLAQLSLGRCFDCPERNRMIISRLDPNRSISTVLHMPEFDLHPDQCRLFQNRSIPFLEGEDEPFSFRRPWRYDDLAPFAGDWSELVEFEPFEGSNSD